MSNACARVATTQQRPTGDRGRPTTMPELTTAAPMAECRAAKPSAAVARCTLGSPQADRYGDQNGATARAAEAHWAEAIARTARRDVIVPVTIAS